MTEYNSQLGLYNYWGTLSQLTCVRFDNSGEKGVFYSLISDPTEVESVYNEFTTKQQGNTFKSSISEGYPSTIPTAYSGKSKVIVQQDGILVEDGLYRFYTSNNAGLCRKLKVTEIQIDQPKQSCGLTFVLF